MNKESEKSGNSQLLYVPGGQLAYDFSGRGVPVIFIHAAIADRRMWNREMEVFGENHQVVRFDMRGYGGSQHASGPFSCVEDIRELIKQLKLQRPFLAGCSMGGGFAINYAVEYPDEISGLLLAAPGLPGTPQEAFTSEELSAFEYDWKKSTEISNKWSEGRKSEALDLLRQLWCSALKGKNMELFMRMAEENAEEVFTEQSMQLVEEKNPAYNRLDSIRAPTTVMVGDCDNPSSIPFANLISRGITGSKLVHVPGADHLINLSQPDVFEAELRTALERATGPRR